MGVANSLKLDGVTEVYPGFTTTPGGGKTFLVHSSGAAALSDLPAGFAGNPDGFFQTVNAALNGCRAGRGDKIIVLPGHSESIATADAWSALGTASDVEIVGVGTGSNRPTFTWTTATSSVLFDQPNVKLRNCRLFLAGAHAAGSALTVAAPITVTADGAEITDCEIAYGFQANRIVGIGITTTAAATRFKFNRDYVYAETIAVPTTTFLRLTGTDFFEMDNTDIIGPGSTTAIGPVQQLTTAMLKARIYNSRVSNTLAASTIAFTAIAGSTGTVHGCAFGILAAGNGITAGSGLQVAASYQIQAGAAGALCTG
jgi:hypothetical protein